MHAHRIPDLLNTFYPHVRDIVLNHWNSYGPRSPEYLSTAPSEVLTEFVGFESPFGNTNHFTMFVTFGSLSTAFLSSQREHIWSNLFDQMLSLYSFIRMSQYKPQISKSMKDSRGNYTVLARLVLVFKGQSSCSRFVKVFKMAKRHVATFLGYKQNIHKRRGELAG